MIPDREIRLAGQWYRFGPFLESVKIRSGDQWCKFPMFIHCLDRKPASIDARVRTSGAMKVELNSKSGEKRYDRFTQ